MVIDAKTLDFQYNARYPQDVWVTPWYLLHRVDLHSGIRKLAVDTHKIPLHLSSQVVEADCETGQITLEDGTTIQKDLIIAADGIHVSLTKTALPNFPADNKHSRGSRKLLLARNPSQLKQVILLLGS